MRSYARWVALIVTLVLIWLVFYPNLFVLRDSLAGRAGWSLEHYARFAGSAADLRALWNSVWLSTASVFFSALIGIPLAFFFARYDFPGRRFLAALSAMPVLLPPLVGVISFLFLYGETGFFTRGVQELFNLRAAPWRLNGAGAVLFVHAYTMYVYFFMFTLAALARLDPAVTEAASALGASRTRAMLRITLPMLAPAIGGAALLVFMTSMGSFSAPYVFGGGFRVLTTQIFASKLNGDLPIAAVETVILAAVSIVFLVLLQRYERDRSYTGASKGNARMRLHRPATGGRRALLTLAGSAIVLLLILPHLTVLLVSFVPEGSWTTQIVPPRYSLANYRLIFGEREGLRPILNSVVMSTWATLANVVFALAAAYLLARRKVRARWLINALVVLPWALPGTVLAIALASTFSVNQWYAGRFVLVGTAAILPLAYFIRNIPLVTRSTMASFQQIDPSLEEASASLGGTGWMTWRRVLIPMVLPGLAAGALLAFVTALGEFVASILLYTHRTRPISLEILAQLRAFNFGAASAYAVLLIALMAVVFAYGQRAISEERSSV
ncbi:MAG TPA: iron ABC transporter permease [Longimicrobiales bacterium]|nr:iron ABC transporter permease [Longimicrobiales bacterium]